MIRKTQYFITPNWDGTCTIEAREPGRGFRRFEGIPRGRANGLIREWQIADAFGDAIQPAANALA
jgi:hypothetical protein